MSDFLFYISCAFNIIAVLLLWATSSRVNDLKEDIEQLNEVVDRKQARLEDMRERYKKLSELKENTDDITEEPKIEKDCFPKNLWVFYGPNESYGVASSGNIKETENYKKFLKWIHCTEKPTFTFYYSNGSSKTVFRNKMTSFEVK